MTLLTIVGRPWITPWTLIGLFCVLGLFYGFSVPARDSLVSLLSPPDAVGKSFGFAYTGLSLGGFISPILLGVVIDEVNVFAAFQIIAVSFLVAALIIIPIKFISD